MRSFTRRAAKPHAQSQLAQFFHGESFFFPVAMGGLILQFDGAWAPRYFERVGLDAVQVTSQGAHQLRQPFGSGGLRGNALAPFAPSLGVDPSDVAGIEFETAVGANQARDTARRSTRLPDLFVETLLFPQFRMIRQRVAVKNESQAAFLQHKRTEPQRFQGLADGSQ